MVVISAATVTVDMGSTADTVVVVVDDGAGMVAEADIGIETVVVVVDDGMVGILMVVVRIAEELMG